MNPMSINDRCWIYVYAPRPDSTVRVGKWLLFVKPIDLDEAWKRIHAAIIGGQLGPAAKARTARKHPLIEERGLKVICVYTRDSTDHRDKARVRRQITRLGFTSRLRYKTGEQTRRDCHEGWTR